MTVGREVISQDGWSGRWRPKIIEDDRLDESFGYEIVIVRLPRFSDKWWRRAEDWLFPPEPVSISQVLPLEQAIEGAIRLHDMKAKQHPPKDAEVCVRIFDPSN